MTRPLSPREFEVVERLAQTGETSAKIAKALFKSEYTICNHIENATKALGVRGRVGLVIWYYRDRVAKGVEA